MRKLIAIMLFVLSFVACLPSAASFTECRTYSVIESSGGHNRAVYWCDNYTIDGHGNLSMDRYRQDRGGIDFGIMEDKVQTNRLILLQGSYKIKTIDWLVK